MGVRRLSQVITTPQQRAAAPGPSCCHNEDLEAIEAERLLIAERDLETARAVLEEMDELLSEIVFELQHRDDRNENESKLVQNELAGLRARAKHAIEGE